MNSQNLKASVSFVGDGTTNKFYFGFDYINKQFIKVQVGEGEPLTYPNDYTVEDRYVILNDTPSTGLPIRVYRETTTERIVEWADGEFIKASQMTLENLQLLHLMEEAHDYPILNSLTNYPDGFNFNALGHRITNVKDPKDSSDVVTKHYMESVQNGFVQQNTALANTATEAAGKAKDSSDLAKKWAMSLVSPDGVVDTNSPTGYTQSAKIWAALSKEYAGLSKFKLPIGYYNSVSEMRASETALVGRPCVTLGYYAPNDGGGAVYTIRQKKESDTDDGGSVLVLDNGNVAELMIDGDINVKQFGAKGDGIADDYDAITKALYFSYLKDNGNMSDGMYQVKAVRAVYFPIGKYKISKTLKITEARSHFVLDMSSCTLLYTGTDYAIEVRRLRQSTIKIGDIYAGSGGGIHFVAARDVNGDTTDYYQYVKLYFNTINAKTDCIFIENRVNGWGNECQVYGGRLQQGNYGIRTFQDSTDDINHWTFYNIGFEGVQVGCLLHSEPVNDHNWHSLSEHVFFQCRVEDSKIALKTEGSVQNCLWIDASFPHLDKFQFSDLTKVFKFITPWGEYFSNSFIPKNADFDDYYFAGNYNVVSNDVFSTLSNRPYKGQAGKLEVSYLTEPYYHIDAPQKKGYVLQKYTDITGTIWQRIRIDNTDNTWGDWKQFPSTMEYYGSDGDDFNNNTADGVYFYLSNDTVASCKNYPINIAGRLEVKQTIPGDYLSIRQEYYPYDTTDMYIRIKTNNTWGDWKLK